MDVEVSCFPGEVDWYDGCRRAVRRLVVPKPEELAARELLWGPIDAMVAEVCGISFKSPLSYNEGLSSTIQYGFARILF